MTILKPKSREAFTLIEMLIVIVISISIMTTFSSIEKTHSLHHIDAQIFSSMMKAISLHESQDIILDNKIINQYHPQFSFSRSFTYDYAHLQIVFHIGRGYYAIQKRN